jgi:hypothetical protein
MLKGKGVEKKELYKVRILYFSSPFPLLKKPLFNYPLPNCKSPIPDFLWTQIKAVF